MQTQSTKKRRSQQQQRRQGRPLHAKSRKRRVSLSRSLQYKIRQEAKKLGLSPNEYVRIAVSISKSFLDIAKTDNAVNLQSLAKIVDSPIWTIMIQSLGPTINGLLDDKQIQSTESDTSPGLNPPGPNPPGLGQPFKGPSPPPPGYW